MASPAARPCRLVLLTVTSLLVVHVTLVTCAMQASPDGGVPFPTGPDGRHILLPRCNAHFCNGGNGSSGSGSGSGGNNNDSSSSNSHSNRGDDRLCSCEPDCHKRRDCCLDAIDASRVSDLMTTDLYACIKTLRGHGPYLMIGRCPANWTTTTAGGSSSSSGDGVRRACEGNDEQGDPNRALPVTSTRTNHTYKNIYCGQCNEGDIKPGQFHLRFRCEEGNVSSVQAALHDSSCDAYVDDAPDVTLCSSMEKTVSSCPDNWTHENGTYLREVQWRCEVHFGPVTVDERRYKNAFCAVCHGKASSLGAESLGNVTCRNSYYPIEKEFVLSLDGEFAAGALIPNSGGKVCSGGQVYDPFRAECRSVVSSSSSASANDDDGDNKTATAATTELPVGEWNSIELLRSASPCNMTLLPSDAYENNKATAATSTPSDGGGGDSGAGDGAGESITVKSTGVVYQTGEYELVAAAGRNNSVLLCSRATDQSISLFPQHFCERRHVLGYGSCGCHDDCVQSRSCCLDAFDDTTVDAFRRTEPWTCLNDSRRTSAVAKCPANFSGDADVRRQCESPPSTPSSSSDADPLLDIPVFAWEHSVFYRNVFCSVCNGATNVTFHQLRFLCAEHAKVRNGYEAARLFAAKPGVCEVQMQPAQPDLPVKPCVVDAQCKQCPPAWGQSGDPFQVGVQWRCEHYYAPIAVNGVCYRNDFCAVCNGIEPNDAKNKRSFSDHLLKPRIYSDQRDKGVFTTFTVG